MQPNLLFSKSAFLKILIGVGLVLCLSGLGAPPPTLVQANLLDSYTSRAKPVIGKISPFYPQDILTAPGLAITLDVPAYSQNDSRWANQTMGNCSYATLGAYGCWVTSYAMLYSYYRPLYIDPDTLNAYLWDSQPPEYASNETCFNIMPEGSPYAPSGVVRMDGGKGIYNDCPFPNCVDESNKQLLYDELDQKRPVLLLVHEKGSSSLDSHMVVLIGYFDDTWKIIDPWDGSRTTLASKNYVVDHIIRWQGTLWPRLFSKKAPANGSK